MRVVFVDLAAAFCKEKAVVVDLLLKVTMSILRDSLWCTAGRSGVHGAGAGLVTVLGPAAACD